MANPAGPSPEARSRSAATRRRQADNRLAAGLSQRGWLVIDPEQLAKKLADPDYDWRGTLLRLYGTPPDATVTVDDLARTLGVAGAPEKVARFAGCFTAHDPRTGQLPKRWQGKGMAATFTQAEAEQIEADWYREATHAEGLEMTIPDDEFARELASRYRD